MSSILESLTTLLSFKSVMDTPEADAPFGRENRRALDFFLGLGKEMGFTIYNADGYAGHIEYGEGDITVGILVHLDVVPAGSGWSSDPFTPVIRDDKLYARGAMDDKGPAIAALYALKKVKDDCEKRGVSLGAKIRLIAGCNEENGSECIKYYKTKVKMPDIAFSPDSDFPVTNCEKGLMGYEIMIPFDDFCNKYIENIKGGMAHNAVPDYAEITLKNLVISDALKRLPDGITQEKSEGGIKLVAHGKSAHSMEADKGDNAVWKIFDALQALQCPSEDKSALDWISHHLCKDVRGRALGIDFSDKISGGTIVNLVKSEMRDNSLVFLLDMRVPVTVTPDAITAEIKKRLPDGAAVKLFRYMPHLYVEKDSFLITALLDVYRKHTGDTKSGCLTTAGGTYARTMDNCVAFGATMPEDNHAIPSPDEWISVTELNRLTDIFADAITALAAYKPL